MGEYHPVHSSGVLIASPKTKTWWKEGPVYQIWPASYKDSNDDGMGDLGGIISTLPYLQSLGIKIVWVCPIYDSPQFDMGYDISSYEKIYAPYGSVADVEVLVAEAHKLDMKVIFDLVVNHTSHQHVWFEESRSSKVSPKRDWYHWRPAKYSPTGERLPPNNWRSFFQDSAWEWDEDTQEYYLHLFTTEQPDLNWENPVTRQAIYDSAVRFWLDKGIDGFRIDTCNMYSKPMDFPDAEITDPKIPHLQRAHSLFCNGPRIHEFLREMNELVFSHYDCMTVGELPFTPSQQKVLQYVDSSAQQMNMVFNFEIVDLGQGRRFKFETYPYGLPDIKRAITSWQTFVDMSPSAWTTVFVENHDQCRSISRYFRRDKPDLYDPATHAACGKLLALLLCALTGTLFIYQGQEIGMVNIPDGSGADPAFDISDYQDIEVINYWKMIGARAYESDVARAAAKAKALRGIQDVARDHARTPVQWSAAPHAGFTGPDATPWMRVNPSYARGINVEAQEKDPGSVLNFWRELLALRAGSLKDLFIYGSFELLDEENEEVMAFWKKDAESGRRVLVVLNFTGSEQRVNFEAWGAGEGRKYVVGNLGVEEEDVLRGWEGRVYEVL